MNELDPEPEDWGRVKIAAYIVLCEFGLAWLFRQWIVAAVDLLLP